MAITSCHTCGKRIRSTSIDHSGELAICVDGHSSFDASNTSRGGIRTGSITVTPGSSVAIGDGAIAIGRINRR